MPGRRVKRKAKNRRARRMRMAIRADLMAIDPYCMYCGKRLQDMFGSPSFATIEHIWPQSHGGTWDMYNLGLACAKCNL